jgi:hypothetical protein
VDGTSKYRRRGCDSRIPLELEQAGFAEARQLVPLMFLAIVVIVIVYGLTAPPLARWLRLAQKSPQGVLILGAHETMRPNLYSATRTWDPCAAAIHQMTRRTHWHRCTWRSSLAKPRQLSVAAEQGGRG